MKKQFTLSAALGCAATCIALSLGSVAFGVADLSDWIGIDNMAGANNYALTSSTSAGGTFADRRLNAASLSDHSVGGSPYQWNSPLSMSGTVTFSNAFDPVMFIGWYNSNNLIERIGIGVANPVPAGTGIRWQTQSGNVAGTGVLSQNFTASTTTSTFAPGTYSFTFEYDGSGHMTGMFDTLAFARNYALPNNALLNMDRFGILQKSNADDDVNTYTFSISNLNYTGDTQISEGTPGDYNGDGTVDAADYVVWRKNDINGQQGYDDWRANFGAMSGRGTAAGLRGAAVPEPSSLTFALAFLLFIAPRLRGLRAR